MEAVETPAPIAPEVPEASAPVAPPREPSAADLIRRNEYILDALRTALSDPSPHRVYKSGKLPGLFPARTGVAHEAAQFVLREGLFETIKTEIRGSRMSEWVQVTPKGLRFWQEHDSPRVILEDFRRTPGETQAGLPVWMATMQQHLATFQEHFEKQASEMIAKLKTLNERVEAALQRMESSPPTLVGETAPVVPWAPVALRYLDNRRITGTDCPLRELFQAVRESEPELSLHDFHDGLRRLHELRALHLVPAATSAESDLEFALLIGTDCCSLAKR